VRRRGIGLKKTIVAPSRPPGAVVLQAPVEGRKANSPTPPPPPVKGPPKRSAIAKIAKVLYTPSHLLARGAASAATPVAEKVVRPILRAGAARPKPSSAATALEGQISNKRRKRNGVSGSW
jgi:hypothetical protein